MSIFSRLTPKMPNLQNFSSRKLLTLTVLLSYFYTFMEWLFFATKPSFMSDMPWLEKVGVLFGTGGTISLLTAGIVIIFLALSFLLSRLKINTNIPALLAVFLPSVIAASLVLILLDNFTYTIFKFGVVNLPFFLRGAYALGFILLFLYFSLRTLRAVCDAHAESQKPQQILGGVLLLTSLIFIMGQIQLPSRQNGSTNIVNRPNILIIGSDGVNAENMSLYGYGRETTPNLDRLAPEFLVAENAFTNGGSTTISVLTILTGKNSTETKLISSNSILQGADAYQHLPGILRGLGYHTVQIGVPHFVDSYVVNLQDGFDLVNGRSYDQNPLFRMIRKIGLNETSYFLSAMFERVSSRILHIFYIQNMVNPIEAVTNDEHAGLSDPEKVAQIIDLVNNSQSPVFIHSHFMGTHGPTFNPTHRVFSANQEQSQDWMGDYYDDSILDFDGYVNQIIEALSASGKLDDTILVIYTDHNMLYRTNQRIPLLIRFPSQEWSGRVMNNVQNIDIAPTILDFLGIEQPEWMSGLSFLHSEPPQDRLIQSGDGSSSIRIVLCSQWYRVALLDGVWSTGEVGGHTAPCSRLEITDKTDIPADIREYLAENNVKILDLPDANDIYSNFVVTRGQLAPILLQKKYGVGYTPPPSQGIFADVQAFDFNIGAMEQIYNDGIMEGCSTSPLSFCPDRAVTREEVAIYLLKAVEGRDYQPPAAQGIFADVPLSSPYAPWVEELYARHITQGCLTDPLSYCPSAKILGEHLGIFLSRAFSNP